LKASVATLLQLSKFDKHCEVSVNIRKECMIKLFTISYKVYMKKWKVTGKAT